MAKTIDYDSSNPSDEMLDRGRRYSDWLKAGLDSSPYKNIAQLAEAMNRSRQTLYPYFNNCIAGDGRFRSPGENITKELATALGLRWQTGAAIMAGTDTEKVVVTAQPKAESAPITRIIADDAMEVVDYYEGLPGPLQQEAREYLKSLNEVSRRAYRRRSDILGKLPEGEDNFERIPEE